MLIRCKELINQLVIFFLASEVPNSNHFFLIIVCIYIKKKVDKVEMGNYICKRGLLIVVAQNLENLKARS